MVRSSLVSSAATSRPGVVGSTSPSKQGNSNASNDATGPPPSSSTIREIRSRTISGNCGGGTSSARQQQHLLLGTRRQAASMERLNGGTPSASASAAAAAAAASSMNNINSLVADNNNNSSSNNSGNNNNKGSSVNGSSQSINAGSTASSPSRGSSGAVSSGSTATGGLNRTASRVSRFRSAKAVFERLSSSSSSQNIASAASSGGRPERSASSATERPRGTVASRYAAAAVARSIAAQQAQQQLASNTSPRSRLTAASGGGHTNNNNKSPVRTTAAAGAGSPSKLSHHHHNHDTTRHPTTGAPRPQPRVTPSSSTTMGVQPRGRSTMQPGGGGESPAKTRAAAQKSTITSTSATNSNHQTTAAAAAAGKPPPRDLIDKIVLEIARDANEAHDANCTIQDLSNCDISGIPETLDFDKCFQDVEMMTEEEARKLLSRKSGPESPSTNSGAPSATGDASPQLKPEDSTTPIAAQETTYSRIEIEPLLGAPATTTATTTTTFKSQEPATVISEFDSPAPSTPPSASVGRNSVRFSHEPATIFDTYAPADYDRRNDDIDPVAASAEYEIEKSREREGLSCGQEEEAEDESSQAIIVTQSHDAVEAVIEKFNSASKQQSGTTTTTTISAAAGGDSRAATQTLRSALRPAAAAGAGAGGAPHDDHHMQEHANHQAAHQPHSRSCRAAHLSGDSYDSAAGARPETAQNATAAAAADDDEDARRDYVESLEREVSLKRIFEQNLRELQSQYYETVKQLDAYKGSAEGRVAKLEASLVEAQQRCECAQGELADARQETAALGGQLTDMKESSQLLEKKYHRAKRIIKDMQSREESFTRREQLYQQKLDEIEYELGVLISTIDRTIHDDGLKYFSLLAPSASGNGVELPCTRTHATRLDVFGLIRAMCENFKQSQQPTQSVQIKQRIVSMLEQQLANLLALNGGGTTVVGNNSLAPTVPILPTAGASLQHDITMTAATTTTTTTTNSDETPMSAKHKQHPFASHRLSQPNMPHPIGLVGGQATKIFHSGPTGPPLPLNEPSPPQSVNSYPSTNSLNSLTNNNNNQQSVNNNNNNSTKLHEQTGGEANATNLNSLVASALQTAEDTFHGAPPPADIQTPYQTDEWHNKPVSEWTTSQVSTWLLALGLDQYISRFEDRNVNGQSLINLDSTVLKGLGVLNSNDRNLLKKKIRELRVEMEKERKIIEKKIKENLKEKSKMQASAPQGQAGSQKSWKKSLLS